MTYKQFWEKFHQEQKDLKSAFEKQDQFDVGYHLGILHSLRFYGINVLEIPFERLDISKECN